MPLRAVGGDPHKKRTHLYPFSTGAIYDAGHAEPVAAVHRKRPQRGLTLLGSFA